MSSSSLVASAEALTTVRDMAERLGVSGRTVHRRLRAAGIQPVRTALGVPQYPPDTAERIAEPTGASEETALASASTSAVAAALDHIRSGYEAALAAERGRSDAAGSERDRLAAAQGETIAELRRRAEEAERERDRARGELVARAKVAPATTARRPWWRVWGVA